MEFQETDILSNREPEVYEKAFIAAINGMVGNVNNTLLCIPDNLRKPVIEDMVKISFQIAEEVILQRRKNLPNELQ